MAADTPKTPDTVTLRAVADRLEHVVAHREPEQAKALLAILIADLRVNSRSEGSAYTAEPFPSRSTRCRKMERWCS